MLFIPTKQMNVKLKRTQYSQLSSMDKIKKVIHNDDVIAFDIIDDQNIIGFAMLQKFDDTKFFLWDYAIDVNFQNKGYGTRALIELISFLKTNYNCTLITTTYKFNNNIAKRLYENIGFRETDVVYENNVHEVNMELEV